MKSKRRPLSIKWKFFLSLLLFAGVLLLLLWLLQVVFLESFYKFYKTREIRRTAEVVAENIDDGQIGSLLEQISRQQGISAAIVDPQDMTVLRRQEGLGREADFASQEQLQLCYEKAWENGGTYLAQKAGERAGQRAPFFRLGPPGQGCWRRSCAPHWWILKQGERAGGTDQPDHAGGLHSGSTAGGIGLHLGHLAGVCPGVRCGSPAR